MSEIKLLPCPFCGSLHLELSNAHTALFWVECLDCEARQTGYFFEGPLRKTRYHYSADPQNKCEATLKNLHPEYKQAAESAIESWNRRAAVEQDRAGRVQPQECKRCATWTTTMGVGNGSGNLFVHGDHDSIKAAQAIVFEYERLKKAEQQAQRKPLTVAELGRVLEQSLSDPLKWQWGIFDFARAVERYHGIGEQAQEEKSNV